MRSQFRKAQRAVWRRSSPPSVHYKHQETLDCTCKLCRYWNVGAVVTPFRLIRRVFG